MKRIMIIGSGGSGKSTLARQLGDILKIKVFHLDYYHWKPGWIETPKEKWIEIVDDLSKNEEWIIDGNYGDSSLDMRFERADTIIFMDFSRVTCLLRVIKRRIQNNNKVRLDMGAGCIEKIDWEFIKWIWFYPKINKPKVMTKVNNYLDKNIIVIHNSKEKRAFLSKL